MQTTPVIGQWQALASDWPAEWLTLLQDLLVKILLLQRVLKSAPQGQGPSPDNLPSQPSGKLGEGVPAVVPPNVGGLLLWSQSLRDTVQP